MSVPNDDDGQQVTFRGRQLMDVAFPAGFKGAGVSCGIKQAAEKKDLTLLVSEVPASAAGVFTTNKVCAAPVQWCRQIVPSEQVRAVVINSGNANACTGRPGFDNTVQTAAWVAEKVGCEREQVLVASTGIIGRPLPMEKISKGIADVASKLGNTPGHIVSASEGILTTDTVTKVAGKTITVDGKEIRIFGVTKGAAMIGPNMATMLGFILTDAAVAPADLDRLLRYAVDRSFHCISVEGHTSTNDSVILLANGASGVRVDTSADSPFAQAITEVCAELAQKIILDAEGASHLITIDVVGLRDDAEARRVAKVVADSALVKTAVCGNDPNWGRICSAAGYSGVEFAEADLSLKLNGTLLYDRGVPTPFDEKKESERMKASRETHFELIFTLGSGQCRFWSSDLTVEYVHLNADYTT